MIPTFWALCYRFLAILELGIFQPKDHFVELADGTRTSGVALKKGEAEVCLQDTEGRRVTATLKDALYIPSYPQDIFSVKAATANGASVNFRQGCNQLIHQKGKIFDIKEYDRLYFLNTVDCEAEDDACYDIQTWHETLGHWNYDDVSQLEKVTEGMKIKGGIDKSNFNWSVYSR